VKWVRCETVQSNPFEPNQFRAILAFPQQALSVLYHSTPHSVPYKANVEQHWVRRYVRQAILTPQSTPSFTPSPLHHHYFLRNCESTDQTSVQIAAIRQTSWTILGACYHRVHDFGRPCHCLATPTVDWHGHDAYETY
jgi:hypothetical protein